MQQLHTQQLIKWLKHQRNVLLNLLHCGMDVDSHYLNELLLDRSQITPSVPATKHNSQFPLDQWRSIACIPLL
jgi:hypothetical protein